MLTYPATQSGEEAFIIQGTESMELVHGGDEGLHRWGVHEVKREQIIDSHGFQGQHGARQVGALDLRHVGRQHFVSVGSLCVQPVGFPGPCAAGSPCPLLRLGLHVKYFI